MTDHDTFLIKYRMLDAIVTNGHFGKTLYLDYSNSFGDILYYKTLTIILNRYSLLW